MVSFGQLSRRDFGDSDPASVAPCPRSSPWRLGSGSSRVGWTFHRTTDNELLLAEQDGCGDRSSLMALAEIRQGCSSKFPTLGGCHCSGRRVPVAA